MFLRLGPLRENVRVHVLEMKTKKKINRGTSFMRNRPPPPRTTIGP